MDVHQEFTFCFFSPRAPDVAQEADQNDRRLRHTDWHCCLVHSGLTAGCRFQVTAKSEADGTTHTLIVRAVAAGWLTDLSAVNCGLAAAFRPSLREFSAHEHDRAVGLDPLVV
jgi:hypothetical protein